MALTLLNHFYWQIPVGARVHSRRILQHDVVDDADDDDDIAEQVYMNAAKQATGTNERKWNWSEMN
jgi:hypothetical protein